MPIPKPRPEESKPDFISRCVAFLLNEGRPRENALAICFDAWENRSKKVFRKA